MIIGLRQFSADTVEWFEWACEEGTASRSALALNLARREKWHDYRGQPSAAMARKVMPRLAAGLDVALPARRSSPPTSCRRPAADYPDKTLSCTLAELGEVQLAVVDDREVVS